MPRFEYVELTVDFAAGTWRDSVGRRGPLPTPARRVGPGLRPSQRPNPPQQIKELMRQFRAEGWGDMAVLGRGEPGLFKATFRRPAATP
jgi:hypothetical protein